MIVDPTTHVPVRRSGDRPPAMPKLIRPRQPSATAPRKRRRKRSSSDRRTRAEARIVRSGYARPSAVVMSNACDVACVCRCSGLPGSYQFWHCRRPVARPPYWTCVVGSTIITETAQLMTDSDWSRSLLQVLPGAVHGAIVGVSSRIRRASGRQAKLCAQRPAPWAVDNESHVVASTAAARVCPWPPFV